MDAVKRWSWLFGVAGFFALLGFLSLWFVLGASDPYATGFGVAAALLLAAYAFFDYDTLEKGARSRVFRYGAGSIAMIAVVAAISVLGYGVVRDHDHRWDLTRDKRYSLGEKSIQIAQALDRDVEVYAFFRTGSPERDEFEKLLKGYTQASPRITVQWLDPLLNPRMAEMFTVTTEYGTVVLVSGDDRQRLESEFDEDAFTEALVKLTSGEDHRICWAMGHSEADPDDDSTADGFGGVVLKLEDMNYTITKTNTLTTGIERDCEALVIARPETDWLPLERERLAVYLAEGGRVFVLLEPEMAPELAKDLHRYGVIVGDDIVLDVDPSNQIAEIDDPSVIVLSGDSLALHPITEPLRAVVTLWIARSVKGDPMVTGVATHELMQASEASWGETTLDIDPENPDATPEAFRPDEGIDLVGRVPLMVAATIGDPAAIDVGGPVEGSALGEVGAAVPADFAPTPGGRLVVVGDTDFATNRLMILGNNQDLFTNSIAWLVEEESQLGEAPDDGEGDLLTLNVVEGLLVWLVHVFVIPGISAGLAVLMMLRRRFL